MSRKKIFLIAVVVTAFAIMLLALNAGPKAKRPLYGVTFSPQQAESLNLDWKEVYKAMLTDLQVKRVRISAYWKRVEPKLGEYDFSDLDFQVKEAEARDAKLVLAVGRRLPRWPECHDPNWLKDLKTETAWQNELLAYIEAVVLRYKDSPAVEYWQVENEPFLGSFGECPKLDEKFFDRELALVKKLDPVRPIIVTDTGELALWIKAGQRGDVFGSTLYRYVFSDVFNRYWMNYNPYWLYRAKGGLLRLLNGKKELVIIELQAEPWTTKGIVNTPIEEQFRTMSLQKFKKMLSVGRAIGFEKQYLWGVEWWYWMRGQGHSEFWNQAKEIMK